MPIPLLSVVSRVGLMIHRKKIKLFPPDFHTFESFVQTQHRWLRPVTSISSDLFNQHEQFQHGHNRR